MADDIDPGAGELDPEYEPFYEAWQILRHDRQYGMSGPSRISFVAIDKYARRYGIEGEEFDLYHELIGVLDDEFLIWCSEEREKTKSNASSPPAA